MDVNSAEIKISKFLRFGVYVTAVCFAASLIFRFALYPNYQFDLTKYNGESLMQHWRFAATHGYWGVMIAYIGFGVLVSLPILRVLFTALLFLKTRDYILGGVAVLVFLILICSFLLGVNVA